MIILNFFLQALKIILMLSALVVMHELGHFSVAKFFKMPVREFSVGFGKKLFSKEYKGTMYSIRLLPLGGYVDIDDENREGTFANAPLYQKNLVLIAGVFVNFVFAFIMGIIVLFAQGDFVSNKIEGLNELAPIYSSGIQVGDEIYKIDGKRIRSKNQIDTIMALNNGESVEVEVKRNDQTTTHIVKPYTITYPTTGFTIDENNNIISIQDKKNNDKYNLSLNDKIVLIDNIEVKNSDELINTLVSKLNNEDKIEVPITVLRNNEKINTNINVEKYTRNYIGVVLEDVENTFVNKLKYSIIGIGDFIYENFRGLILLVTGQNQNAQLMGIVGVSEVITKTTSVLEYLSIMVSISLSLGIVNLIPIPLLDGGKIVLFTIERYRKKQFSEKFMTIISNITFGLLILLTIYIMIGDIRRII